MQKLRVVLMRGLPGSGKSTHAKALVNDQPGRWVRINRDDLRTMMLESHSKAFEKAVAKMRDGLLIKAIQEGYNVVIDDTNLDIDEKLKHFKKLLSETRSDPDNPESLSLGWYVEFEVVDLTHVPIQECVRRDIERGTKAFSGRMVGEKVIKRMAKQFLMPAAQARREFDPNKPTVILSDMDGTLALIEGRSPYDTTKYHLDKPNKAAIEVLRAFRATMGKGGPVDRIIVVSAREEGPAREPTVAWLKKHSVPYDELFMRSTGDFRNDAIVKKEILDELLASYNILFVLDDRNRVVDMWRENGIDVFQVNEGDF